MDTILIPGIETVVGSNLAAAWAESHRIVGFTSESSFSLTGCETVCCPTAEADTLRDCVASYRPDRIVYCGGAARSSWQSHDSLISRRNAEAAAETCARAAREFGSRLTVISTDAVFTGPWMFHKEESPGLCDSIPASTARSIEQSAIRLCEMTLVIRTNAYGWSAKSVAPGWIEQALLDLESNCAGPFDYLRYGTPILATDLVDVIEQAWQNDLEGIYHIAGAERVNPNQFVEKLASEFGLPAPRPVEGNSLLERPTGFGRGETSLHTGKVRQALGVAMPTLTEGLERLREQKHNDYCDRLEPINQDAREQVA